MNTLSTMRTKTMRANTMAAAAALSLLSVPFMAEAQRGAGAVTQHFNATATDYDKDNAYLLTYLCSVIYPENLMSAAKGRLIDPDKLLANKGLNAQERADREELIELNARPATFEQRYRTLVAPLFTGTAEFKFFSEGNSTGYDPEAMGIATDKALFVVFRGTDRVAKNNVDSSSELEKFMFGWSEWLATDFDLRGEAPGGGIPGKIHRGFWNSLRYQPTSQGRAGTPFHEQIRDFLNSKDPAKVKPVWITGHSLGAAHSQAFAAYLASIGRRPQGVYPIAAPHIGNKALVDWLNANVGKSRIQRFDFIDDPVTMLPSAISGYDRAGTRNYYDDVETLQRAANERLLIENSAVLRAVAGVAAQGAIDMVADTAKVKINVRTGSEFGYHHPAWYLRSAYNQLSTARRAQMPAPLDLPTANSAGCSPAIVARAMMSPQRRVAEKVEEVKDRVEETVEAIQYNMDQLLKNATGHAITEGEYRIRCMAGGKYLDISGEANSGGPDGIKPTLWSGSNAPKNNRFKVTKTIGGYRISREGRDVKFLEVDAKDLLEPTNADVQMWGMVPGPHQVWLFYQTNKKDHYILYNPAARKALNAYNDEVDQNGGRVNARPVRNNDKTMVWIFEKI
jgi:hypothetical protein